MVQYEHQKWAYQSDFLAQWRSKGIDALLLPVQPWVAYEPKVWVKSKQWLGYTALWNLLQYAAVTVPVATVDSRFDQPDEDWRKHVPRNASDEFNHTQCKGLLLVTE